MDESTIRTIAILLSIVLPILGNWFANGFPTDRASLGYLGAAFIGAILVFIQRWLEKQSLKLKKVK